MRVPKADLLGHGLLCGSTGSGKSWAVVEMCRQLVADSREKVGIGVIDAKGDLVERLCRIPQFNEAAVLDFNSTKPVAYGLMVRRAGESIADVVERRMEVFEDVLGRDNQTSLRMGRMLRSVLVVLAEHDLPFALIDHLLSNPELCRNLGTRAADERVAAYFRCDFSREVNSTLAALQSRLDFLLRHRVLRASFSAATRLEFGDLMGAGIPVLVNAGGPNMPRALSRVVQSLLASDLRKAVFSRTDTAFPYLWFVDEAQELFKQPSDIENLTSLLTMARSFGAFLALMTQSPTAACPDRRFLQQLVTNVRWTLMLRSASDDARLIEAGLPVTGRRIGRKSDRGQFTYLSAAQERQEILEEIGSLPDQVGYLWVRGTKRPAIKCRLPYVKLAPGRPESSSMIAADVHFDHEAHVRRLEGLAFASGRTRTARASSKGLARLEQHIRRKERDAS